MFISVGHHQEIHQITPYFSTFIGPKWFQIRVWPDRTIWFKMVDGILQNLVTLWLLSPESGDQWIGDSSQSVRRETLERKRFSRMDDLYHDWYKIFLHCVMGSVYLIMTLRTQLYNNLLKLLVSIFYEIVLNCNITNKCGRKVWITLFSYDEV